MVQTINNSKPFENVERILLMGLDTKIGYVDFIPNSNKNYQKMWLKCDH